MTYINEYADPLTLAAIFDCYSNEAFSTMAYFCDKGTIYSLLLYGDGNQMLLYTLEIYNFL